MQDAVGFTLIEVMVATMIIAVITAIVYASLSSVTHTTELARVSADEMRMRQFLSRSFLTNFASVYADPGVLDERFAFLGTSESGSRGEMDSVEFCSSTAVMGGASPPGAIKRVHYGAVSANDPGMGLSSFEESDGGLSGMQLQASESLVMDTIFEEDTGYGIDRLAESAGGDTGFGTPSWTVPVSSFDVAYFDGAEWLDEWDSLTLGRLPWSVRIRIGYALTEEEAEADAEARFRPDEDPDYELIIPIPIGVGAVTDAATWYENNWPQQQP